MSEPCDVCCGTGRIMSGLPCICKNGTIEGLVDGLREIILRLQKELNEADSRTLVLLDRCLRLINKQAEKTMKLEKRIEELEEILDAWPRTKDGELVLDGHCYVFPRASGYLSFWAHLGPQYEQIEPYPWNELWSSEKAARSAKKSEDIPKKD